MFLQTGKNIQMLSLLSGQLHVLANFGFQGTGMDSGFLLMQEWCLQIQRSDFSRTNPTEINVKVARGVMLSITIADLTSVIAFTIGSFTPFLAVNVCW